MGDKLSLIIEKFPAFIFDVDNKLYMPYCGVVIDKVIEITITFTE